MMMVIMKMIAVMLGVGATMEAVHSLQPGECPYFVRDHTNLTNPFDF